MLRGIHKLCDKARWSDAVDLLTADTTAEEARAAASTTGGWGEWTPLHLACKHDPPLGVVNALLDAAPIAAETFDVHDNLPLHYAVDKGCSDVSVISALVEACPESAEVPSKEGEIPLMISFRRAAASDPASFPSEKEVEILACASGEALLTEDIEEEGAILLHQAVRRGAPIGILRPLVEACPASATVPTKEGGEDGDHTALMLSFARERNNQEGSFPSAAEVSLLASAAGGEPALFTDDQDKICLHRAIEEGAPLDVVLALVEASPESLTVLTFDGDNALTLAFKQAAAAGSGDDSFPEPEKILMLVDNPSGEAALIKDEDGKTCLHRAVESNAPLKTLVALVQASLFSTGELSGDGETPLMMLIRKAAEDDKPFPSLQHIKVLMDAEGLMTKDKDGDLSLHKAIQMESPIEVVQALVTEAPKSISVADKEGRTALHMAIDMASSIELLNILVKAAPELLSKLDAKDETPLMILIRTAAEDDKPFPSLQHFKVLMDADGLMIKDKDGEISLQKAIQMEAPTEVVEALVKAAPESVAVVDKEGKTSLHMAVDMASSIDMVNILVQTAPELLGKLDDKGETPLMILIRKAIEEKKSFPSLQHIKVLMDADGLMIKDKDGEISLHKAIQMEAPTEVVEALVKAAPESVAVVDKEGKTSLHMSIDMGANVDVVDILVKASPDLVSELDGNGETPLMALINKSIEEKKSFPSLEQVKPLVDAKSVMAKDKDGEISLHKAIQMEAPIEVVEALVKAAPESVAVVDKEDKTSLHMSIDMGANVDVVDILVKASPDLVSELDGNGETPLMALIRKAAEENQSFPSFQRVKLLIDSKGLMVKDQGGEISLHKAIQMEAPIEVVEALVKAAPESVAVFDKEDKTSLDVAITNGTDIDVMQILVKAAPDLLSKLSIDGETPLMTLIRKAVEDNKPFPSVEQVEVLADAEAVMTKDKEGEISLHKAIRMKAPNEVIEALIKTAPESAAVADKEGKTPLHMAIDMASSVDMMQVLVNAMPELLAKLDSKGETPLMTLIRKAIEETKSFPSVQQVELLVDAKGVMTKDQDGKISLHKAIQMEAPLEVLQTLVKAEPKSVAVVDKEGRTSLHMAVGVSSSVEVLHVLLNAMPEATIIADKDGYIGLHHAIIKGLPFEALQMLVNASPGSVSIASKAGEVPLMTLIRKAIEENKPFPSVEQVELLVDAKGLMSRDQDGEVSLHKAIQMKAPIEVVDALVKAEPKSVAVADKGGKTSLHMAINVEASVEVLKVLVRAMPETTIMTDNDGYIGLHHAIAKGLSIEVMHVLVDPSPGSVSIASKAGEVPLMMLIRKAIEENKPFPSVEEVELLVDAKGLMTKDKDGEISLHKAIQMEAPVAVVEALVEEAPGSVSVVDKEGKTSLHMAIDMASSIDMVNILVGESPALTSQLNTKGETPLMMLIRKAIDGGKHFPSLEQVKPLLDARGLMVKAQDGEISLHKAIQMEAPVAVVEALVKAAPESVAVVDNEGKTPLHMAIDMASSIDMVNILVEASKSIVSELDGNGETPLMALIHNAVKENKPFPSAQQVLPLLDVRGLMAKDQDGEISLHKAIQMEAPIEVVEGLVKAAPETVAVVDKEGKTSLHMAVDMASSIDMVNILVQTAPELLGKLDDKGETPLMILIRKAIEEKKSFPSLQHIKVLMDADGLMIKDKDGEISLHKAIQMEAPTEVVEALVKAAPESVAVVDKEDKTSLHMSIDMGANVDVVDILVKASPDLVSELDGNGETPLMALINKSIEEKKSFPSLEQVKSLVDAKSVMAKDKDGEISLHKAIQMEAPIEVVEALVKAAPESVAVVDKEDKTSLHMSIDMGANVDVVDILVKASPDLVSELDGNGETPLMALIRKAAEENQSFPSFQRVKLLIDSKGLMVKDQGGEISLHKAIQMEAPIEVVEALVKAAPESVAVFDKEDKTSLDVAITNGTDIDVMQILVKAAPDLLSKLSIDGETPLMTLIRKAVEDNKPFPSVEQVEVLADAEAVMTKDKEGEISLHKAIRMKAPNEVIEALIKTAPESAAVADKEGKTPLHMAIDMASSVDMMQVLVNAMPELLAKLDSKGETPLMTLIRKAIEETKSFPSVQQVELLVDAKGVMTKDQDGKISLHKAIQMETPLEVLQTLVKAEPKSVAVVDKEGRASLHMAVGVSSSVEVLHVLLNAMPEATIIADKDGYIGLHHAIIKGLPFEALQMLVNASPGSVSIASKAGEVPLMTLIRKAIEENKPFPSVEQVEVLVDAKGLMSRDQDGEVSLHKAIQMKAPIEVVDALVKAEPKSVAVADKGGKTSLHMAINVEASVEVLKVLVRAMPETTIMTDNDGYIGLHHAIAKGLSIEVMHVLVDPSPGSVSIASKAGEVPLMMLIRKAIEENKPFPSVEEVELLVDAKGLMTKDKDGEISLHKAIQMEAPVAVVEALVEEAPGSVSVVDKEGKTSLHMAIDMASSIDMVNILVGESPALTSQLNTKGETPLMMLIRKAIDGGKHFPSLEQVKPLLDARGLMVKAQDGEISLHKAIQMEAPVAVVEALVKAAPESVAVVDNEGKTPLHMAIDMASSIDMVNILVEASKSIVSELDSNGETPLMALIHNAVKENKPFPSAQQVKPLLDVRGLMVKDQDGEISLHKAIQMEAPIEVVEGLVKAAPESVAVVDKEGKTSLHMAISVEAPVEVLQVLVHAMPEAAVIADNNGCIGLHHAIMKDLPFEALQVLVDASPGSVSIASQAGEVPLMMLIRKAIEENRPFPRAKEVALLLDSNGTVACSEDRYGNNALHYGVKMCAFTEILEILVKASPDCVSARNKQGETPLMLLIEKARQAQLAFPSARDVSLLLDSQGLAASAEDAEGNNALHLAVMMRASIDTVEALVKASPECVVAKNNRGWTPLMLRIKQGDAAFPTAQEVTLLLDSDGIIAGSQDNDGNNMLHHMVNHGASVDILEEIIQSSPASVSARNKHGETPLMLRISKAERENSAFPSAREVSLLMDKEDAGGCEEDADGNNAVHRGIIMDATFHVLETIVKASPNCLVGRNKRGETPLMMLINKAKQTGSGFPSAREVALLLDDNGTVASGQDVDGMTALHRAVIVGASLDVFDILSNSAPKSVATVDKQGKTPLHRAVESESVDVVEVLIKSAPESVAVADKEGKTPLHIAIAIRGPIDTIEMLVDAAPDAVYIEDKDGKACLQTAIDSASVEVVQVIVKAVTEATTAAGSLHYAIKENAIVEVLQVLAHAMPEAAVIADKDGYIGLHHAIMKDLPFEALQVLVDASPGSVSIASQAGEVPLMMLIRKAIEENRPFPRAKEVALLLDSNGTVACSEDRYGNNALHYGVKMCAFTEILEILVKASPDCVSARNKQGETPLMLLIEKARQAQLAFPSARDVSLLLDSQGLAASAEDAEGNNALHLAVMMRASIDTVEALVKASPECVVAKNNRGRTPLMLRIKQGDAAFPTAQEVTLLLDSDGIIAGSQDNDGNNMLHHMVNHGASVDILEEIIQSSPASVSARNKHGETPLMLRISKAERGNSAFPSAREVSLLMDKEDAGGCEEDADGNNAVHRGIIMDATFHVLETIVKASPNCLVGRNKQGETPLMMLINKAKQTGSGFPSAREVALLLDDNGTVASGQDVDGMTALHHAVLNGASNVVLEVLVKSSPKCTIAFNNDNETPFMLRVNKAKQDKSAFPSVQEVSLLLDANGLVASAEDADGNNALHLAVLMNASVDVLEMLVESSPKCSIALNRHSKTPLLIKVEELAAEGKPFGVHQFRGLVDSEGQTLLVQDADGQIALHRAMSSGAPTATLEALVSAAPSSIKIKDGRGRLALHHCVESGAIEFVDTLIKSYPVSITHQDKKGLAPLHLALLSRNGIPFSFDTLTSLLGKERVATEIAYMADKDGRLPLHCACQNLELVPPELIVKLIELNPKSPSTKMMCGKLPIDLIEAKRKSITYAEDIEYLNTVSDLIFSHHPNVMPYRTELARLQRFKARMLAELSEGDTMSDEIHRIWTWMCTVPDRYDRNMQYRETIESIIKSIKDPATKKMLRNIEVDTPAGGSVPLYKCVSERMVLLLSPLQKDMRKCLKDVAQKIKQAHSRGYLHGNVASFKIARRAEGGYDLASVGSSSNVQHGEYIGSSAALASSGGISPLMIAALDFDGYFRYRKYWKTVSDDAQTYSLINQLDIAQVTDKVQKYLPTSSEAATFSDLLARINANNELWTRIKPKRHGSKVYAMKCFYENPITGLPLAPGRLPYELIQANEGHDLWSFGLVLHESLTGAPLFGLDSSNNLVSGADYAALYEWDTYGSYVAAGSAETTNDPVAMNLLQKLLHKDAYTSTTQIDRILDHPYFSNNSAEARKQCLSILSNEKERRETDARVAGEKKQKKEEEKQAEKSKLWMSQRTEVLDTVSLQTKIKFDASTWKQWGIDGESTLPTSFVLLPYRLETSAEGITSVSTEDLRSAQQLGASLAGVLRYVKLLSDMSPNQYRGRKNPASNALWRYNELNKHINATENTFLGCCRDIVTRVDNAKDVLCSLLPATNDDSLSETASLLIHTRIKGIVDVEACRDILKKASAAKNAMQILLDSSGGKSIKTVQEAMGEQFDDLLGVTSMREQQAKKKASVQQALTKLVKSFSEDSLGTAKKLLGQKVAGLCSTYMSSRNCYLYLVDEVSGFPAKEPSFLSSTIYPLKIDNSIPDDLTVLIPCMLPTLKEVCISNAATGLASLLGLSMDQIPSSWCDVVNIRPGECSANSTKRECDLLHAVISCGEITKREDRDLYRQYKSIILSRDVRRDFGGMKRIRSPCGEFLWTSEVRGEAERELERAEIKDYIKKDRAEKMEKVSAVVEAAMSSQESGVSRTADSRSVYERAFHNCWASAAPTSNTNNSTGTESRTNDLKVLTKSLDTSSKPAIAMSPRKVESVEKRRKARTNIITIHKKEDDESENNQTENKLQHPPTPGRMFKQSMIKRGQRAFKSAGNMPL